MPAVASTRDLLFILFFLLTLNVDCHCGIKIGGKKIINNSCRAAYIILRRMSHLSHLPDDGAVLDDYCVNNFSRFSHYTATVTAAGCCLSPSVVFTERPSGDSGRRGWCVHGTGRRQLVARRDVVHTARHYLRI